MNKFLSIIAAVTLSVSIASAEHVRVTEVTEITKPYTVKVQTGQQCYDDTVEVLVNCGYSESYQRDTNTIGVDTLVGATIGTVIGSQIGSGNGRTAAQIVGGLVGANVANNNRSGTVTRTQNKCKSYETVRHCNPTYEYKTDYKTIGYNNCAMIDGKKYCVQTSSPVKYLNVVKTISVY